MDLGNKCKNEPCTVSSPKKTISYPSFSVSDEAFKRLKKQLDADVGDTVTATVRLRVESIRQDRYGSSIGFEVNEINDMELNPKGSKGTEVFN